MRMFLDKLPRQRRTGGNNCTFRKTACSAKRAYGPVNRPLPAKSRTTNLGPFGEVLRSTGPMARANPFRFSTKYQDDETDLLYYGHRYYSTSTGRWLSRDPIEEKGGRNLYCFVRNNAICLFDALGKAPQTGKFTYDGVTVNVTADAWALFPCMGGPISLHVHWYINEDNQGMHYLDGVSSTFYDDSVPGPSNGTVFPPSNPTDYPIEWDNFYDKSLPLCPEGQQQGSITYVTSHSSHAGGLKIIFHWTYSCSCACVRKHRGRASTFGQTEARRPQGRATAHQTRLDLPHEAALDPAHGLGTAHRTARGALPRYGSWQRTQSDLLLRYGLRAFPAVAR